MEDKSVKKIGLWNVIGLGVGGAVGSGIFVILGSAIEKTGRSILPITIICVFYMLLAYWYNLALSGIFVIKGGDYSMKGMVLPPLLTGFGGWGNVIWAFGCTSYALAITNYLGALYPQINDHTSLISVIVLTFFFLLTIRGSRFVTIFQNIVTVCLIVALIMFVLFGFTKVDSAQFFNLYYDGGFFRNGFTGIIGAIAIMGWACQGTTMGPVGVVSVTKNPKRTIPVGIVVTCIVVSIIYGLMSYVAAGVLPYDQVAGENLSVAARTILPNGLFSFFVIGGGICAIISSFLMVLVMIRYPLIHMAEDGWLPAVFRKHTKDGYPYVSYLLVYLVALIPIVTKMSVDSAVSMLMIPTMLINVYLNAYCILIPKKYPEQYANRALKMPTGLYNVCCILGSICAAVVALTLFLDLTPRDTIIAICVVLFPTLFSWIALKKKSVDTNLLMERRKEIVEDALKGES